MGKQENGYVVFVRIPTHSMCVFRKWVRTENTMGVNN